ncbi:IS30 family transposase [Loktanella sp. DJP18]|uniref:IS30 family transposase n=1 Tax=Loktanella sp. DJP18 TaxID=3409788 RepID=UPI003BB5BBB5
MDRHYNHLDAEERGVIFAEHRRGSSLRQIGRLLGRHHGTIGRELVLGASPTGYDPQRSHQVRDASARRSGRRRKLVPAAPYYAWVRDRLIHWRWSPEQIAARLRLMHPDDPSQRISHEAIYAAIYAQPRGGLKVLMIEALRQAKPKRGMRRTTLAGSAIVPETLRIIHRPEDIEARLVPGHWEGDLIKGAFNRSAIGTVVERKTRFVILSKMQGCTANAALEGFTRQMKRLPVALRQSMTYDRGSEMACHPELSRRLKIDIWFCDPHAPWQRGSNENTNGLLRQFFPKGTDLSCLSQTALNDVARMMNHRPRKTLGWRTPAEAMAEELAAIKPTVALQT